MNLQRLLPIEAIRDTEELLRQTEALGEVIILRDNKPAFRIATIEPFETDALATSHKRRDLWQCMDLVLAGAPGQTMHAKALAKEITARGLYFMKDGSAVSYAQIRARAAHKPTYFECCPGNYIRLRKRYEK